MVKYEKLDWDAIVDINTLGPLCDPRHPNRQNRARHRHILEMMFEVGNLTTIRKILAAYPYLQDEYADRMARAVREEEAARLE